MITSIVLDDKCSEKKRQIYSDMEGECKHLLTYIIFSNIIVERIDTFSIFYISKKIFLIFNFTSLLPVSVALFNGISISLGY